ncbi:unnamed protein product [Microthlaspi erraticum]|uniref:Uncharacterized protein n=1 Tax=Microthlaspi erraticum TaxID=1685480 RepID=A0A6D2J2K3_9BRAS|nr:unnamed protein product [Microthlaspi erraticum]
MQADLKDDQRMEDLMQRGRSDGSPSGDGEKNQDEQMEDAEAEQEEDELPMYQEHYNALFSMDFVRPSTHMMTQ